MGKKDLTEQEIRSQYIRPAIVDAGWKSTEILKEYYLAAVSITSDSQSQDVYARLVKQIKKPPDPFEPGCFKGVIAVRNDLFRQVQRPVFWV